MPTIAIIDDRRELRQTLKNSIDNELIKKWHSIDIHPLPALIDYYSWIIENEIAVILLDERLHERTDTHIMYVNYNGHDLVDYIRQTIPTLPIFIITSYPQDNELLKKFKDVEEIIKRDDFCIKADAYVPRILRSAQKFLETFEDELNELAKKAEKIAKGTATQRDIQTINAIRAKIGLVFPSEVFVQNNEIMLKIEKKIEKLKKAKRSIEKHSKTKR